MSLARRDTVLASRITAADAQIDALQSEIEEKAVLTIARRQPMAVDLREIVGALRLANDLERIGDLLQRRISERNAVVGEVVIFHRRRDTGRVHNRRVERGVIANHRHIESLILGLRDN